MSLRMWYEDPVGTWNEVDFVNDAIGKFKFTGSTEGPAKLTWSMHRAQHTQPIPDRAAIVFVDTDYGTFVTPVFEGHVYEIQPVDNFEVQYTAYDATHRAGNEILILSGPVVFPRVVPRLVYNAKIENDDDYAFEREHDYNVGQIITDLLTDPYALLVSMLAAPPTIVGGNAFEASDLTAMDYQPQEKVVFETEGLRAGLDRMLSLYPKYRIIFEPGHVARKWRFRDVLAAPTVTLTLNDWTQTNKVLSMDLSRSMLNRATAVEIRGPNQLVYDLVSVSGGGLTELWEANDELQFIATGPGTPGTSTVWRQWQITDETKRQVGNLLPQSIYVGTSYLGDTVISLKESRQPTLQVTYDSGATWIAANGFRIDKNRGIIDVPYHIFQTDGSGDIIVPDDARLHFSYYDNPVSARHPTTGFSGTAYSEAGLEYTLTRYDEALTTGYEDMRLVTMTERLQQFKRLARSLQEAHRDIVYAGGCVLKGIQYEFIRLNKRINFAAKDQDGNTLVTGWETAQAILTDVEYDYEEQLTTLTFSSDHLEFSQTDPEMLKNILKIRALSQAGPGAIITWSGFGNFYQQSTLIQSLNEDKYGGEG